MKNKILTILIGYLRVILDEIQKTYTGKIIIFNLSPYNPQEKISLDLDSYFKENPDSNIFFLDVNHNLNKDDYFVLDVHIRNTGQVKIANTIENFIMEKKIFE